MIIGRWMDYIFFLCKDSWGMRLKQKIIRSLLFGFTEEMVSIHLNSKYTMSMILYTTYICQQLFSCCDVRIHLYMISLKCILNKKIKMITTFLMKQERLDCILKINLRKWLYFYWKIKVTYFHKMAPSLPRRVGHWLHKILHKPTIIPYKIYKYCNVFK